MSRWISRITLAVVSVVLVPAQGASLAQGNGILVAEWDANTTDADLSGYRVFVSTDPTVFDLTPQQARSRASTVTVPADAREATLASLDPTRTYYVAATAFDWSGNESTFSNVVAAQPCATSTSGSLSIAWDPDPSRDLDHYNVYLTEDPGALDAGVAGARGRIVPTRVERDRTSVVFTGLDADRTYHVAVTSGLSGGGETEFAEVLSVVPAIIPTVCSVTPGSAPQGTDDLTVTVTGANMDPAATLSFGPGVQIVSLSTSNAPARVTAVLDIDAMARVDTRDIVVTNPDGGTSTRFDGFAVTVNVARVDLNASARIDGGDLVQIAAVFGARSGEPGYSAALDLNVDGIIDGNDLSLLIAYFGRTGPF